MCFVHLHAPSWVVYHGQPHVGKKILVIVSCDLVWILKITAIWDHNGSHYPWKTSANNMSHQIAVIKKTSPWVCCKIELSMTLCHICLHLGLLDCQMLYFWIFLEHKFWSLGWYSLFCFFACIHCCLVAASTHLVFDCWFVFASWSSADLLPWSFIEGSPLANHPSNERSLFPNISALPGL